MGAQCRAEARPTWFNCGVTTGLAETQEGGSGLSAPDGEEEESHFQNLLQFQKEADSQFYPETWIVGV